MTTHYFAYGSNLHEPRMAERTPGATLLGPACLADHALAMNKHGRDGTAKANIQRQAGSYVWGVVYGITTDELAVLDRIEKGYRREVVAVELHDGRLLDTYTYFGERLTDDRVAADWYKALMVRGAADIGLPDAWIEKLASLPERPTETD